MRRAKIALRTADDGRVTAVNDALRPVRGRVTVTDRASGKVVFEKAYDVPANAAAELGRVTWKGQGVLDIVYEQGGFAAKNWFLYGEPPFRLADARRWFR